MSLGELIVEQLGLQTSTDTLSRWMAHRVAELVQQAEEGNHDAKKEAAELITSLWERRSAWPRGWPPPETTQAVRRLTASTERHQSREADPAYRWLTRLVALDETHEVERAIWLRLALGELDLNDEIAAAEAHESSLDDDERLLFKTLEVRSREAREYFAEKLAKDGPLARVQLAKDELVVAAERRNALFAAAEQDGLGLDQSAG